MFSTLPLDFHTRTGPSAGLPRPHRLQNASSLHFLPRVSTARFAAEARSVHFTRYHDHPWYSVHLHEHPLPRWTPSNSAERQREAEMTQGSFSLRYAPRIFISRSLCRHPRRWAFHSRITNTYISAYLAARQGTLHALVLISSLLFPSLWTSRKDARGFKLSRTHRCVQCRATMIICFRHFTFARALSVR